MHAIVSVVLDSIDIYVCAVRFRFVHVYLCKSVSNLVLKIEYTERVKIDNIQIH